MTEEISIDGRELILDDLCRDLYITPPYEISQKSSATQLKKGAHLSPIEVLVLGQDSKNGKTHKFYDYWMPIPFLTMECFDKTYVIQGEPIADYNDLVRRDKSEEEHLHHYLINFILGRCVRSLFGFLNYLNEANGILKKRKGISEMSDEEFSDYDKLPYYERLLKYGIPSCEEKNIGGIKVINFYDEGITYKHSYPYQLASKKDAKRLVSSLKKKMIITMKQFNWSGANVHFFTNLGDFLNLIRNNKK